MSQSSGHAPLVWFTSMAIAGAGLVVAAAWRSPAATPVQTNVLVDGSVLLAAGIVISTLHLGRWWRAPLAIRGVVRSPLSHEVALASAALAAGLLLWAEYSQERVEPVARAAAVGISMLFLLSIGLVYRLGGQRTWRGASTLLPLTAGLVFGEVYLRAAGRGVDAEASALVWVACADAAVYAARWWSVARASGAGPATTRTRWQFHVSMATRLILLDAVPLMCLVDGATWAARVTVMVGLTFDRFLFYALADQHTTEAEIARVEDIIQRGPRIG